MTSFRFPLLPRSAFPSIADPEAQRRYALMTQKAQVKAKQMVEEARMAAETSRLTGMAAVSAISGSTVVRYI
jgi:hypothetical protein